MMRAYAYAHARARDRARGGGRIDTAGRLNQRGRKSLRDTKQFGSGRLYADYGLGLFAIASRENPGLAKEIRNHPGGDDGGGEGGRITRFRLDRTTATLPPTTIAIAMAAKIAYASTAGKPKIVLPEGLPPDRGLTVSAAAAVALRPTESVTVTVTVKLPVAVGVHVNEDVFAEEQPGDSPV